MSPRLALFFLSPALLMLAVFIVYPLFFTVVRSVYDGQRFLGTENYRKVLTDPIIQTAIKNTAVWVVVAPTAVCALGLVLAVLSERIRWVVAFRLVLFMPMAISLFASGVIFRLVYEEEPERGLANAVAVGVHDLVARPSLYPDARPQRASGLTLDAEGFTTTASYRPGGVVRLPMVGIRAAAPPQAFVASLPDATLPQQALVASLPGSDTAELRGLVWADVSPAGDSGVPDQGERGMPRITVEALRDGRVVATATTGDDGSFAFPDLAPVNHQLRLPEKAFTAPFNGQKWLGQGLVTPVMISCWIWIMAGFAMTFIAAGLAAIPREVLEAARVDGATEGQILRRVTMRLLSPVLVVVFVTLVITALKVFELVLVMAPGQDADVLAVQIWRVAFQVDQDYGLGSALCVVLFLLVTPAMVFNIRRFRRDES